MAKLIGLLTAGGDSPGLNAAIRGIGKAALGSYGMRIIGFRDGFRGLMENRSIPMKNSSFSGILTTGGTILGTSREKPHRMPVGNKVMDMTNVLIENYHKSRLDALNKKEKNGLKAELRQLESRYSDNTIRLSRQLEKLTGLESRVSILGYVQRGGTPSVADRLLATRLGTACAELINNEVYSVMVASRGDTTEPVPLKKIVGKRKTVPLDHPWIESARRVGTNLGD